MHFLYKEILTVQSPMTSPPPQPIQVLQSRCQLPAPIPQHPNITTTVLQSAPSPMPLMPAMSTTGSVSVITTSVVSTTVTTPALTGATSATVNVVKSEPSSHIAITTQTAIAAKHAQQQATQVSTTFNSQLNIIKYLTMTLKAYPLM